VHNEHAPRVKRPRVHNRFGYETDTLGQCIIVLDLDGLECEGMGEIVSSRSSVRSQIPKKEVFRSKTKCMSTLKRKDVT
jgi:hypothetical protein